MPELDAISLEKSLQLSDPGRRSRSALEALGWGGDNAFVDWATDRPGQGRLVLGTYPTLASFTAAKEGDPTPWRYAWLQGYRWCLVLSPGSLGWFDLRGASEWQTSDVRSSKSQIQGFTPSAFRIVGRFEPTGIGPTERADNLPVDVNLFLRDKILGWWNEYLRDVASHQDLDDAKRAFSRFLSAVLLLRTVEDTNMAQWLPHGSLQAGVERDRTVRMDGVRDVLRIAAAKLNSRVLKGVADMDMPHSVARRIVSDSYDLNIDFAGLDVDPVGAFYEGVLGVGYRRERSGAQTTLFWRDEVVKSDPDARRERGVYYTPRSYAETLARLCVRPAARTCESMNELPLIADLAAGSGELLAAALREIFSVGTWRTPEAALTILDKKIFAVDENPVAANLCALNMLRAAIRHVPELLVAGRQFPDLNQNIITGDALSEHTLKKVPDIGIALVNPPFHGPSHWDPQSTQKPSKAIFAVKDRIPNTAFAFLAILAKKSQPNAAVGAVVPSQLLTGMHARSWRDHLSASYDIETVIANYANTFQGAQSYAGLLVCRRRARGKKWRPRVFVVRVDGGLRLNDSDLGAILSSADASPQFVSARIVAPITPGSADWLGGVAQPHKPSACSSTRAALSEVIGSNAHEAPMPAPQPWGRELFIFRQGKTGELIHSLTGAKVRGASSCYRQYAMPNRILSSIPLLFEPVIEGQVAFLPGDGGTLGLDISDEALAEHDPVAFEVGQLIRKAVLEVSPAKLNEKAKRFQSLLREYRLQYMTPNGFKADARPMIVASRATRSPVGIAAGVAVSSWLNEDGATVPLGGLQLRVQTPEVAALVATWLSLPECAASIPTSERNLGTGQILLGGLDKWSIPDLRLDRHAALLEEFYDAFIEYRDSEAVAGSEPSSVEFKRMREVALSVWRAL